MGDCPGQTRLGQRSENLSPSQGSMASREGPGGAARQGAPGSCSPDGAIGVAAGQHRPSVVYSAGDHTGRAVCGERMAQCCGVLPGDSAGQQRAVPERQQPIGAGRGHEARRVGVQVGNAALVQLVCPDLRGRGTAAGGRAAAWAARLGCVAYRLPHGGQFDRAAPFRRAAAHQREVWVRRHRTRGGAGCPSDAPQLQLAVVVGADHSLPAVNAG